MSFALNFEVYTRIETTTISIALIHTDWDEQQKAFPAETSISRATTKKVNYRTEKYYGVFWSESCCLYFQSRRFLRNVGIYLRDYTVSHPGKQSCSLSSTSESHFSHGLYWSLVHTASWEGSSIDLRCINLQSDFVKETRYSLAPLLQAVVRRLEVFRLQQIWVHPEINHGHTFRDILNFIIITVPDIRCPLAVRADGVWSSPFAVTWLRRYLEKLSSKKEVGTIAIAFLVTQQTLGIMVVLMFRKDRLPPSSGFRTLSPFSYPTGGRS
jgi:hypothetical protein